MQLPKLNQNQVAVILISAVVLLIIGGLVWGFWQKITLDRQMRVEEIRLEQMVATEQARYEILQEELEYVQSDAYIEEWARVEARMVQPGEVLVVPPENMDLYIYGLPTATPSPTPTPSSWWDRLWYR